MEMKNLDISDFEGKTGSVYTLEIQGKVIKLVLNEVKELEPIFPKDYTGPKPDHYRENPFALTFCGPGDIVLPMQVYELKSEDGALYAMAISAFLQNKDGIHYEAIFK